jgi:hypothetical protein
MGRLGTVLDPELDEPITDLDFVESCTVSKTGWPVAVCQSNQPSRATRYQKEIARQEKD